MTTNNEVALVTGGNKGLGREIVRRLATEGMTVYLGARDESRGRVAAKELEATGGDVRFVLLDVTDQGQVDAAVKHIASQSGRVDVLINNAGIVDEWGDTPPAVTADQLRRTYEVNVFGVVAVTHACLPLLRRSSSARVVNMSSPLGSLQLLNDPGSDVPRMLAYGSSKAALNAITLIYADALRDEGIHVNTVDPGYVATDLNDHRGVLTVEQGAETPVRLALLGKDAPTGSFVDSLADGGLGVAPW